MGLTRTTSRSSKPRACARWRLSAASKNSLTQIKGLSEQKVEKLKAISKKTCNDTFQSATSLATARENLVKITTGSQPLDDMLMGGIESGSMTELYGEFRTGKTQLMHTLAVSGQIAVENGGGGGKVMYIDTEGTFRPERIMQIAERFRLDGTSCLDNIAYESEQHGASARVVGSGGCVARTGPLFAHPRRFRHELVPNGIRGKRGVIRKANGVGEVFETFGEVGQRVWRRVVVSNQVVANPEGGMFAGANAQKPIGGNIMAHASTTRLALRKGRGGNRVAKNACSPTLPESEAQYSISDGGIVDPEID